MWHEARKQEKKIRGMMVDYRKRAERRRDFYEKFKADPTQFLQLHGRPCKIHLDPAIAVAGDSASVMMPWQGHPDILIDRFDVRAHLDTIIENPSTKNDEEISNYEERTMNYERYRILVQNEFLGVNEEKFLNQIHLEEQFGPIALKQSTDMLEKEKRRKGAAIGFIYEDSTSDILYNNSEKKIKENENIDKNASDSDDSDLDFDLCLDLSQIDTPSAHEMNSVGQRFGLLGNDFFSFLTNDVEEQEVMRLARQQEEEKAMFSGRKARRERQAFREKKLMGRVMSPPSYAARKSPTYDKYNQCNKSMSRSTSPENAGQITYITSFGGDDSNDEKQEKSSIKYGRRTKKQVSRERDDRSFKSSSHRNRRSKSLGSRSRSKSPKRRRKYTRSRSAENKSLASNLKKLISKKNEKRSRSESSDRFKNYSKWRSRNRSSGRQREKKRTLFNLKLIFHGKKNKMIRIITNRYSEGIRMIARQKPNMFRYQHEKVRPSEDATPKVAKPLKEEMAGSIPFIPLQGADDSVLKKSSKVKVEECEEPSREVINPGKQYWKTFYRKYETGTLSAKDFLTLFKGVYSEAQYQKFQEAPNAAYTISCFGLLPLCSIGVISLITGGTLPWLAYVQLTYSASVLSFLGGVNWGHTISSKKVTMESLGWGVIPPVLAWSAVLLPLPIGFAFTATGLTASLIHDILLTTYPQWFKSLRYVLTVVALLSLLPTFFMTALKF